MVAVPELVLLAVVALVLAGVYYLIKNVKALAINAVVGLIVLWLASAVGFGVEITPVVFLVVALGGLPGAVLVWLLAHLNLMFEPLVALPVLTHYSVQNTAMPTTVTTDSRSCSGAPTRK